MSANRQKWIGLISGIIAAAIWGGMYVISKVVLEIIPPFTLLTLRLVLGVLTLLPFVARYEGIRFSRGQWFRVLIVGLIGYGVSLGLQLLGTKMSTASNGALVTSTTPTFVFIFAAWILGERFTVRRFASLGLATIGVILVLDLGSADRNPSYFWGNVSLICAALTWALYSVLIGKVTRGLPVLSVSLVTFLGGLSLTIPGAMFELEIMGVGEITVEIVLGVLYLGIVSTGLAMYLWNTAFAKLDAGVAGLTFFAQPIVGVGLGFLFLGEQMAKIFFIGGIMIGLGLVLAAGNDKSALADGV